MTTPDPARARLLILTLVRLFGILLIAAGMLLATRNWLGDASRVAGIALLLAGLAQLWLVPRALLRAWRTPK